MGAVTMPCTARSTRGYAIAVVIFDEAAWYVDTDGSPLSGDELWQALVPSTAGDVDVYTVTAGGKAIGGGSAPVNHRRGLADPAQTQPACLAGIFEGIGAPGQISLLLKPGVEIEDLGAGAKAMIRDEEDRSLWASHSDGCGHQSIELSEVIKAERTYFLFPD